MNGKIVKEWLEKADQDYRAVQYLKNKKQLHDVVCFHCQQSAEKYLKAYLTSKNVRFPKTHDLMDLQVLAEKVDGSFALIKDVLNFLNQYSVRFRYPGEEADKREAMKAVNGMGEFHEFILARF